MTFIGRGVQLAVRLLNADEGVLSLIGRRYRVGLPSLFAHVSSCRIEHHDVVGCYVESNAFSSCDVDITSDHRLPGLSTRQTEIDDGLVSKPLDQINMSGDST